jgi:hypothetical protein
LKTILHGVRDVFFIGVFVVILFVAWAVDSFIEWRRKG